MVRKQLKPPVTIGLIAMLLSACSAEPPTIGDPALPAIADSKRDGLPDWLSLDGTISAGAQTSFDAPARTDFGGVLLRGGRLGRIEVTAEAIHGGKPMLWLTDGYFGVLDQSDFGRAEVALQYPVYVSDRSSDRYLLYRDYGARPGPMRITVSNLNPDAAPPSEEAGCPWGSRTLYEGEEVPRGDGCNVCWCNRGSLQCTSKVCEE